MTVPFPDVPDLAQCLQNLLAQIPIGRVTTCGDLADALGNRIAARWVGHMALHHEHDADCICHRIVRAGGELGGYAAGSIKDKAERLADEGVDVENGKVDFDRFGFTDFRSDRPLERLRQVQESIQREIVLRPRRRIPKYTGGVDVSYPRQSFGDSFGHLEHEQPSPPAPLRAPTEGWSGEGSCVGTAAYTLVETETGKLVWSKIVRRPVRFPYISTYLSFREIPILLELLDEVRAAGRMAEVLLVDGSGILHHRHAGIASHLGVVAGTPTIGVTKKLLCGNVDVKDMAPGESRPVWMEDQLIGVALRPTAGSARPIFISPGHRVDVPYSEGLVRRLLFNQRLPVPIRLADRLSRNAG